MERGEGVVGKAEPLTAEEQDRIVAELEARADDNPFAGWSNAQMARAMATIALLRANPKLVSEQEGAKAKRA